MNHKTIVDLPSTRRNLFANMGVKMDPPKAHYNHHSFGKMHLSISLRSQEIGILSRNEPTTNPFKITSAVQWSQAAGTDGRTRLAAWSVIDCCCDSPNEIASSVKVLPRQSDEQLVFISARSISYCEILPLQLQSIYGSRRLFTKTDASVRRKEEVNRLHGGRLFCLVWHG